MKNLIDIFKALVDEQRIRILMLLDRQESSVCQIMGIIGSSQPLVSRNLAILMRAGFLEESREGKLRFYRIKDMLSDKNKAVLDLLRAFTKSDIRIQEDIRTLADCTAFQKKAGRCDMQTLREFMKLQEQKRMTRKKTCLRGLK